MMGDRGKDRGKVTEMVVTEMVVTEMVEATRVAGGVAQMAGVVTQVAGGVTQVAGVVEAARVASPVVTQIDAR